MKNYGFLGLDISKGYADLFIITLEKKPVEPAFRLYDVADGHKKLEELITKWLCDEKFDILYCGVESTGGYENNWVNHLYALSKSNPLKIARLNAKGVKSLGDAALTRTITDSVSAENIAAYLVDFRHKIRWLDYEQSPQSYRDGRRHNTFIRMLKKQRVQLSNQLEKLLYQELSPLMCYCRHGAPTWLLFLLHKYPTIATINKAGVAGLGKIKGVTPEKAAAILTKTKLASQDTSAHIGNLIKSTIAQILALDVVIEKEKKKLIAVYKHDMQVKLLTSIAGVGMQSAVEIIIEIEDVRRFESAKKLSAYFGLHPTFKQSGDGKWGNHMSKKGRSEIRAVLFMSALTAIRHSELFKGIYANARAKGKSHFNAMGIVMHKLLRIIFGILKHGKEFSAEIDAINKEQAAKKLEQKKDELKKLKKDSVTKLERHNDAAISDYPVSKRYAKKKKTEGVT